MKTLKKRRGSYIAEAAVVFPAIITVTVTAVLIIMFFYSQMTEQSRLHMALREHAGLLAGNTKYIGDENLTGENDAEIYSKKTAFGGTVYGKKYMVMKHKGVLEEKGIFVIEGNCHVCQGVDYVRYCNILKGNGDEQ